MSSGTKATRRKTAEKVAKRSTDKNGKREEEAALEPERASKSVKYGPMPTFPHQRVWTRSILIVSVVIVVWCTSKDKKEVSLATRKEVLAHRGQAFDCSESFRNEIDKYPGCKPSQCGRHVSDQIITDVEVEALSRLAVNGLALGRSEGSASILDLHSGALSHGRNFINVYSLDEVRNVLTASDLAAYKLTKAKIQSAIAHQFQLDESSLHLTYPTFFSKLTNAEPKTVHDEYWHAHVDKETYESFHYTSLLYLSDFDRDFTGGRLVWIDSSRHNVTLEPKRGRVVMFTSGEENLHFVERVVTGIRYAITISFTCDSEKGISDPAIQNTSFLRYANEVR